MMPEAEPQAYRSAPSAVPRAPLASWGSRVGAYLIDALILAIPIGLLGVFIVVMMAALNQTRDGATTAALGLLMLAAGLAIFVVSFFYAPVLMARAGAHNGQTWGKEMLGIRVVRDNGLPWTFSSAAIREVLVKGLGLTVLATIVPVIPWLLDYLWPLFDEQNRAVHDIVVSSHVVQA